MAKALRAGFHRFIQRSWPLPFGSSDLTTRSMHLIAACSLGKCPRARVARRRIHALSSLLVWAAVMHGALAGTDATNPVYQALAWLLVLAAVSAGVIRVVMGRNAARAKEGRAAATVASQ